MNNLSLLESTTYIEDAALNPEAIRKQFPVVAGNEETLFFDNASTSQTPTPVIDCIRSFYESECSNVARASYSRATALSAKVESARVKVAEFLNADKDDIAFTGGATESLNMVAMSWGMHNLEDGDEIMICPEDHHSAVYPWLNLKETLSRFGKEIKLVDFDLHPSGVYDWQDIKNKLSSKTRLIALSHIHHLYGMEMDIAEIKAILPENVLVALDASQSAGHIKIDVQTLGADFVSFSGHKMYAANGVGILYSKKEVRETMWPARAGSKTAFKNDADELKLTSSRLASIIECGTLNIPGILSMTPAIDFINSVSLEKMESYISDLTRHLLAKLKELPGIEFAPGIGICGCTKGFGIISFKFKNMESSDLAAFLDSEDIEVRAGDHCRGLKEDGDDYIRVSLQIYNTVEEIDYFAEVLEDACH